MLNYRHLLILLILPILAACQRQSEAELTLVAQKISLETQIVAVRETATIDAERLLITVEYMGTLVGRAEEQRLQLQATLVARDAPLGANNGGIPATSPLATPEGAMENAVPTPDPAQPVEAPENPGQPALQNVVIAPGVGSDDCAINITSNFTTSTAEIYIVATGVNIPAGTNIAARFAIAGQEIRHDFTPDFDINGSCIWFFIDQNDLEFRAGTWSVQLELNGTPASQPMPFTITDEG